MLNIKLTLAYDGTNYQGWQGSIERAIRACLEKIYQHPIYLQGASRTDAGVHAYGQVANFTTEKNLDMKKVFWSCKQLLPNDITIRNIEQADEAFHPSLDVCAKEYRYYICNSKVQLPYHRLYSWHIYHDLDWKVIAEGALMLIGKHDFTSFCNQSPNNRYTHYIREISAIEIENYEGERYCLSIRGNNFLFRMVRNIVGTLIDLGRHKISLKEFASLIEKRDRSQAGISAPAHGLFLHRIYYQSGNVVGS